MPARSVVLLLAIGVLAAAAPAAALEGALSGHLPAGVYTITDDIHVPAGQTLTLAPGVVFEFEEGWLEDFEFDVQGILIADGAAGQPVVFRPASGVSEFNYLRLRTSASQLRHVVVERVGSVPLSSEGGLWIDGCSPVLEDVEVSQATWHGIHVTGAGARPTLRRVHVHDGAGDGFDADDGAGLFMEHCRATDNDGDGVCLASGDNLLVGCLVAGNGEDGIDSHGLDDFAATLVNCTVGPHPSEAFSDDGQFVLYNCLAVTDGFAGTAHHSFLLDDADFLGFTDPAAGDWRLRPDAPVRDQGLRFGLPESVLPAVDLAGQPRVEGIVDPGCYEATGPGLTGEEGAWQSSMLIEPRLTRPVLRVPGETFPVRIGRLGSFTAGDCQVRLVGPDGAVVMAAVESIVAADLLPGGDLAVELHAPGLETIQELTVRVPGDTPAGLHGIEVALAGRTYRSVNAVSIHDAYPDQWTFIHITDTHVGYDQEEYTALERLAFCVREINFLNPSLVVVTGDICENQNLDHGAWAEDFLAAIAQLRVPCLVLPGNHDHYNQHGDFNPHGWFRYFERISRVRTCELRFGHARFYGWNTRHELGAAELYRCAGPDRASLDWTETRLQALAADDHPRFSLMHGPNYDYFSYNEENTGRVRDLMDQYGFALGLAGHTHRFETFRNEGDNWFGRNDYDQDDDWLRDVAFPGYPVHVQTSALGKDEHLSVPAEVGPPPPALRRPDKGLFGDTIGWRAVRVDGGQVVWFSADTDGDGHRNTELGWFLGELTFALEVQPDGSATSTVTNDHHETWPDVRHFLPGEPGRPYDVTGGVLVRRWVDGTLEVAAGEVTAGGVSTVSVTPAVVGVEDGDMPRSVRLLGAAPNPFNPRTTVRIVLPAAGAARVTVMDPQGRLVAVLHEGLLGEGQHAVQWDGRDRWGRGAPSGVYLVRVDAVGGSDVGKLILVR